jgi:hypothetical protein
LRLDLQNVKPNDFTPQELLDGLPIAHLPQIYQDQIRDMFSRNLDVLARNAFDVQHTTLIEAHIEIKLREQVMNSKYCPPP